MLRAGRSLLPMCAAAATTYAYIQQSDVVSTATSNDLATLSLSPGASIDSTQAPLIALLIPQNLVSTAQADAAKAAGALNPDGWTDLKLISKKQLTHNSFAMRWAWEAAVAHPATLLNGQYCHQ